MKLTTGHQSEQEIIKLIYSFLYVLAFSVALVIIQMLDLSLPPLFSLLITASIASIYFNLVNIQHLKKIYFECINNKRQWLIIMLIVLSMWATTMIGPGLIGASLFNFIYFAWLGAIGFILASIKNWQVNKIKFYFGLFLLLLISANVYIQMYNVFSYKTFCGIILALIGGFSSFIYFKESQKFSSSASLSATQVLAVRFYLSIFVLLLILPAQHISHHFNVTSFLSLFLLAFLSLIIPLYFSQKALESITPEQHAIINSLCPVTTALLQKFYFNDLSNGQITIYILYTLTIGSFYFVNKLYTKVAFNK